MARTATVEVQPIDRLEEKVRQLVGLIDTLRAERAKAVEESGRLQRELESLRSRLGEAAGATAELAALREERDLIRARVDQMVGQIDKLSL